MDAIDRLILSSQVIQINSFPGNPQMVQIKFPADPSEETLSPVKRFLSIPGFHGDGQAGIWLIFCPSNYDSFEVAKAICTIWEEQEISFKFSRVVNNEFQVISDLKTID